MPVLVLVALGIFGGVVVARAGRMWRRGVRRIVRIPPTPADTVLPPSCGCT